MADFKPDFLGYNFIWFIGEVEDRNDPLRVGRVRVRCFGWHSTDKAELPTTSLPWAQTIQPVTAPAAAASGLVEGTWVFGFFMDGEDAQKPMIMGQIPGYRFDKNGKNGESELPRAARCEFDSTSAENLKAEIESKENFEYDPVEELEGGRTQAQQEAQNEEEKLKLQGELNRINNLESPQSKLRRDTRITGIGFDPHSEEPSTWDEPEEPNDKTYPYVQTVASESGFITETIMGPFDAVEELLGGKSRADQFTARQVTYDCVGGYDERRAPSGDKLVKVVGDNYEIICGSSLVNIKGNVNLSVDGNMTQSVSGNYTLNVGGNHYVAIGGNDDKYVGGKGTYGYALGKDTFIVAGGDTRTVALGGIADTVLAGGIKTSVTLGGIATTVKAGGMATIVTGAKTTTVTGNDTDTVNGTRQFITNGPLTMTATSHTIALASGTIATAGSIISTSMTAATITSGTTVLATHTHIGVTTGGGFSGPPRVL